MLEVEMDLMEVKQEDKILVMWGHRVGFGFGSKRPVTVLPF
jgi:hypothetical protein